MSTRPRIAAAALALAVALSACTPAPGSPPAASGPTSSSPTPVAPGGVNSRATDRLARGGILRLPIGGIPTQWNPLALDGLTPDAVAVRAPLRGSAFLFDAAGTPRPNPDFITSASATTLGGTPSPSAGGSTGASAGPSSGSSSGPSGGGNGRPTAPTASKTPTGTTAPHTIATLRLNPKAVWGDGAAVTAADWVATFKAIAEPRNLLAPHPGWDKVASVAQGADDHEVVVTYTAVVADWTQPLSAGAVRAASVADPTTFAQGWAAFRADWFAGPYTLTHVDRTQGVLTLEPNPRWWGSTPQLDTVFFRVVAPDAVAAAMAAGEFDLYAPGRQDGLLARARTALDSTVRFTAGASGRALLLSTAGPLADLRTRQAIVRGIDRAKLAGAALDAAGITPTLWSNHLLLPQQPGYLSAADSTGLVYDARAAGQALTQAGWPLVDGVRRGASGVLTLTITVPPTDARAAAEASALAADLAAIGVQTKKVPLGGDLTPTSVPLSPYPLSGVAARFPGVQGLAPTASALESTTDAAARLALAAEAARLLWQNATTLPLYVEPDISVARTRLANLGASGLATIDWAEVGYAS